MGKHKKRDEKKLADKIERDMKEAIDAIREAGGTELADHLNKHITRPGNTFVYTGKLNWITE